MSLSTPQSSLTVDSGAVWLARAFSFVRLSPIPPAATRGGNSEVRLKVGRDTADQFATSSGGQRQNPPPQQLNIQGYCQWSLVPFSPFPFVFLFVLCILSHFTA